MALEGKEMYVFDRLPNYGNVQTKSTLNYQPVSPSWHSGIAMKTMICPTITESPFISPSSSCSLDELPPFSIYRMEDINKGACLQNVECTSEQALSDIFNPDREQPATDHNISAGEPSDSDQSTGEQQSRSQRRKRKSLPKGKSKAEPSTIASPSEWNTESESQSKRHKIAEGTKEKDDSKAEAEQGSHANTGEPSSNLIEPDAKPAEACKQGYIHVRARRGQATDSHSLAERVRREKISERMKFLQDLVPGCSKITGKALMLDEIINYVQSLQHQVEFLSMKLEAVNPQLDFNVEGLSANDMLGPASMVFASDTSVANSQFHLPEVEPTQLSVSCETVEHSMGNAAEAVLRRIMNAHLPTVDGYGDASSQISNAWDDDLQSVVRMGFGQNITSQCFHELFPKVT